MRLAAVLLLSSLAGAPLRGGAQEQARPAGTFRVSAGTGFGTAPELFSAFLDVIEAGFSGHDVRWTNRRDLFLRADWDVGQSGRLGLSYVYTGWEKRFLDAGADVGRVDVRVHSLLGHAFLRWVDGEHFELASGLGLGLGYWDESGTVAGLRRSASGGIPAWQLHLLGMGVGNERVRFVAELGLGFEGILVLGLAVRL